LNRKPRVGVSPSVAMLLSFIGPKSKLLSCCEIVPMAFRGRDVKSAFASVCLNGANKSCARARAEERPMSSSCVTGRRLRLSRIRDIALESRGELYYSRLDSYEIEFRQTLLLHYFPAIMITNRFQICTLDALSSRPSTFIRISAIGNIRHFTFEKLKRD